MALRQLQSARVAASRSSPAPSTRLVVRAAATSTEVPPNVAEARAWIAAWRAKQNQQPAGPSGNGAPAAPAAAPAPKSGSKFGTAMADGTLVFTADQLKSVDYGDVKLKAKKK